MPVWHGVRTMGANTMCTRQTLPASLLLLALVLSLPGMAQTAYKCANSYSQVPCPGGKALDTNDARSPTQKAQADQSTAQAAKMADKLEKDRLAQEKAAPSGKPAPATAAKEPAAPVAIKPTKKKKPAPEYFTAEVPSEKKKDKDSPAKPNSRTTSSKAGPPTRPSSRLRRP